MRVVVHDYSGHPGQVSLSRELARRGHEVVHQYCSSYTTGRGAVERQPDDPACFHVEDLSLGDPFQRYSTVRRIRQEVSYGWIAARAIRRIDPDVVVLSNVPLLSLTLLIALLRIFRIRAVFWQQDIYSAAVAATATAQLGSLAAPVGKLAAGLERFAARQCAAVVPIDESFVPVLRSWGLATDRIHVVPNWAPISELPTHPRDNSWARTWGLLDAPVVLYAGTLGLKHDPSLLADAADELREVARFVVVTEGLGRRLLERAKATRRLDNLLLLDFQPYESVPYMHASADVLLAILEPDASRYSVPSKVLTYLCAERPLVTVMAPDNSAARVVRDAGAGRVVPPGDRAGLVEALRDLVADPGLRSQMGAAARRYAEENFDPARVADRFEAILRSAAS